MAVTKIWAIHDSVSRVVDYCTNPSKTKLSDLEQVLLYAADKEKTLDEGEQQYAVTGIGCRAESAAREMAAVQRRFGKAGGNVAYHAYQSFKTGEVTAEECHRIGVETARRLWGNDRQVLVATHFNTGTYHNHFVVNPVNMWTGKKLEAKYEVYYKLREMTETLVKAMEKARAAPEKPSGKQTVRQLIGQNQGVSNIEITNSNIKGFERIARKYGVDFAVKKDRSVSPPKYFVFFKARDADALTAAFKEYTAYELRRAAKAQNRPSVLAHLQALKAKVQAITPGKSRNQNRGITI